MWRRIVLLLIVGLVDLGYFIVLGIDDIETSNCEACLQKGYWATLKLWK